MKRRRRDEPFPSVFVFGALLLAGCGPVESPRRAQASKGGSPGQVSSNVRFEDYAGTAACARCHPAHVSSFSRSPMHNMTRDVGGASVRAPFDGRTFQFKGDTARFEIVSGVRFVTLAGKEDSGIYRVTRVVGGHYREDFVATKVAALRADAPPRDGSREVVLPVSFVYATQSFRYKGYSVMLKERPGLRVGPVWDQTCIFCHNTVPYLSTVLGALAASPGLRASRGDLRSRSTPYQGLVVDPLLPREKRAEYVVTDEAGLRDALAAELGRLGEPSGRPNLAEAISATRAKFGRQHFVEVGIGCESCHLGAAEHVRDSTRLPSFAPRSSFFAVRFPEAGMAGAAPSRASAVNRACARCHQVLFSGYEYTWEGGARRTNPGGSNINSGEARDMLLGSCSTKLACSDCHDPHASDATAALRALSAHDEDRLCTRCHDRYENEAAARAHSHHDPLREGGRCLACHMPRKTMSLDGKLSRYHRIGSPTDPARVLADRPLECALCHEDASVESLVTTMEAWWQRRYDRDDLARLYGPLEENVLFATAERGKPHEQGVAFFALGRAKMAEAIPVLAPHLKHPIPLVRGYAKRALDAIQGSVVPVDIDADDAEIERATRAWLGSRK